MKLQRQLLQAYLNQRSAKEPLYEKQLGADGVAGTNRRADCTRALETRFGEVSVPRIGYSGKGMDSVFPLDSALNLPRDKYSRGLRKAVAEAVISMLSALGRIGKPALKHKASDRAQYLIDAAGARFPDLVCA